MAACRFVGLPLDKHAWSPSPLLGQVVLVTTVDESGTVDVAPKSWVSMVSFAGPTLGFGCNVEHRTYRNLVATGEFVVNVPSVAPPVVGECAAHLECRHERTVELARGEVFVLGTITSVEVDAACLASDDVADRYAALEPFVFLEHGWNAPLGRAAPPS